MYPTSAPASTSPILLLSLSSGALRKITEYFTPEMYLLATTVVLGAGVALGFAVGFGVAVGLEVGFGVAVGLVLGLGVAVGFGVAEGLGLGLGDGLGVCLGGVTVAFSPEVSGVSSGTTVSLSLPCSQRSMLPASMISS